MSLDLVNSALLLRETTLTNLPYAVGATNITVADSSEFAENFIAGRHFHLVVWDKKAGGSSRSAKLAGKLEIVKATLEPVSNSIDIERGQEGTAPIEFSTGGDWQVSLMFTPKVLKDLNDAKIEGSFKQLYDDTYRTTASINGTDFVNITGLVIGRTYEIDCYGRMSTGAYIGYNITVAVRHDGVNYKESAAHAQRVSPDYSEIIWRTRHTFIATATTAGIRCVSSSNAGNVGIQGVNCVVREFVNMPESTTIGITS